MRRTSLPPRIAARRGLRGLVLAAGLCAAAVPAVLAWAQASAEAPGAAEQEVLAETLWHYRNLGKALYENPTTQYEAVTWLAKAFELAPGSARDRLNHGLALLRAGEEERGIVELEAVQKQDPALPHTWFNLGIAYKRAARYDEALAQFRRMVELVPDDPIAHFQLGVLLKLNEASGQAVDHFRRAAALDPSLAGPHFQLATAYRQAKNTEAAKREMALFREIKRRTADAAVPEDLEWSWYSELYEPPPAARTPPPAAKVALERRPVAEGREGGKTAGPRRLEVLDANADGRPDLVAWGVGGARLLESGERPVEAGLEALGALRSLAAGDYDNDGLPDLAVVDGAGRARLLRNAGGRFAPAEVAMLASLRGVETSQVLWLDYDHDYDLDLFLLGAPSKLARNNGDGTFTDLTADFPFAGGAAVSGVVIDLVSDTQTKDLAVNHDGRLVIYRDRLGGRYEGREVEGRTGDLWPSARLSAADVDGDGWIDLLLEAGTATGTGAGLLRNDRKAGFTAGTLPAGAAPPLALLDLDNRGLFDLVAGGRLFRNQGGGRFSAAVDAGLPAARGLAVADFDADGRVDLASSGADGALVVAFNRSEAGHRWLGVQLTGTKNLKLPLGAEVEVLAGALYQKQIYRGTPLVFGLAENETADTVRITWPNGLIQNETRQLAGTVLQMSEAPSLSGSCPMIFTWNGERFEFITDVLGVAPLGASAGGGEYFPVDHDEYIQIAGESLAPRDGRYEIHVTEELREVAFLDQIRLIALDRPAGVELFTSDKFQAPPFPEHRLYGVEERHYPVTARDHRGHDVRARLLAADQRYPDAFERDFTGVAEMHALELDFGDVPGDQVVLIGTGWVDWADGSSFLAASQADPRGLILPYLQVLDEAGEWRTVVEEMGIPAGKPKTIVIDLTGKFLSAARKVRIVTNLCLYWDELFLATSSAEPAVRRTTLAPLDAQLAFRGFSRQVIHPERKQPERFVYADWQPLSKWNPTPGMYTRYGDVRPLLEGIDDRFVIMGSGDELRLAFDAAALPPLPAGFRRDFLLFVDGWAKDGDANTAYSQTVEPLPYHAMPQYPYAAPHRFPDTEAHRRWREEYNRRPALRLIRPLLEGPLAARGEPRSGLGPMLGSGR